MHTSSGCILQVLSVKERRSCTYKTFGQTDRIADDSYILPHPSPPVFKGGIKTPRISYFYKTIIPIVELT
mgnify:CR=1 FL=1